MDLPLAASQVDTSLPFRATELLYRRLSKDELGENGEVDASRIEQVRFERDVQKAPSVMRSAFSKPLDVLHFLCAKRDTSDWVVYSIPVGELPDNVESADGRVFRFFPIHMPEPKCGAHSVIASCINSDATNTYVKASPSATWQFKVNFARRLRPVPAQAAPAPALTLLFSALIRALRWVFQKIGRMTRY
jgi:hypothetical protein